MFTTEFPVVVISGGTGTGKTKLSLEIANRFDGEIINADALQIYNGMDIATNKVTEEESQGIPHHLLGFKDIKYLDFSVCEFQSLALQKINEIKSRKKMPIVVGGTNYYIESILWETLFTENNNKLINSKDYDFDKMSNSELHSLLNELDFKTASILHPNDRRKVTRAIEIAKNSNQTKFEYFNDEKNTRRFNLNEVIFLWIYSNPEALFPRLDKRVDDMMNTGLLFELEEIQKLYKNLCPTENYTQGIFQAIGFKEFRDYLNYSKDDPVEKEKILSSCIEKLKIANKKYTRTQNQWVKNRFLKETCETKNIPLFKLDSSDLSKWKENVFLRTVDIINQIRNSRNENSYSDFVRKLPIKPEPLSDQIKYVASRNFCEICDNQLFTSIQQWEIHLTSRRHQKRAKKRKIESISTDS